MATSLGKIENRGDPILSSQYLVFVSGIQIFAGLFVISHFNYLLFHSFAEGFSVIIALGVFMVVAHSRPNIDVSYFVFVGTACLFIAPLELLHTISFTGQDIIKGYGQNVPAQLWVLCRLMQSLSLLLAVFFVGRKLRVFNVFVPYFFVTLLLIGAVFYWDKFPACLDENLLPTVFRTVSDKLVILFIACSVGALYWKRGEFQNNTYRTLNLSLLALLCSELLFFSNRGYVPDGYVHVSAHFSRIVSFYFLFKATIEDCLEKPYEDIVEDLIKKDQTLTESQLIAKLGSYEQNLKTGEWFWSDGFYNLLGYKRGEIPCSTRQFWRFIHPDDCKSIKLEFKNYLALHRVGDIDLPISMDFRIINSNKEIRNIHVVGAGIYDKDGILVSHYGTFQDVTERKEAESALRESYDEMEQRVEERTKELKTAHEQLRHAGKLSAVGQLSASIAHEFNNPLFGVVNVIKGVKRRAVLDPEDVELVDMALKECERMKNLIRDLQDFNRPSSGKPSLVDLHKTIDSILLLSNKRFKNKEITIEKCYGSRISSIHVVADQIKQVIMNLLNNAADASKQGGEITIITELGNPDIKIKIADSGSGIKPDDMEHIFEPFFTTKDAVKGTGLGLSVCHGIIKKHGGKIEVESKIGEGAMFTISLPAKGGYHE